MNERAKLLEKRNAKRARQNEKAIERQQTRASLFTPGEEKQRAKTTKRHSEEVPVDVEKLKKKAAKASE
ncbi:unnamed protein product [Toxocara canis]|uniref:DUF4169 family protein n=1 Tax=Toxocara canis TaxID=6265 RepID=A0A183VFS2_TOXCA|nr:unnamed protein product [Toxocara canis]